MLFALIVRRLRLVLLGIARLIGSTVVHNPVYDVGRCDVTRAAQGPAHMTHTMTFIRRMSFRSLPGRCSAHAESSCAQGYELDNLEHTSGVARG